LERNEALKKKQKKSGLWVWINILI
jgi:hypothetical protein